MNRNAILTVWPFEAFVCIYVSFFPTYFFALLRVAQINIYEDFCVHKLLGRREVSEYAVSWRRRRSHGSVGLVPKLFMPCVCFSKYSRDLSATKFSEKKVTFWGRLGVPPVVASEGGSALPKVKPRLSQCCAHIRAPEGLNDSREICK